MSFDFQTSIRQPHVFWHRSARVLGLPCNLLPGLLLVLTITGCGGSRDNNTTVDPSDVAQSVETSGAELDLDVDADVDLDELLGIEKPSAASSPREQSSSSQQPDPPDDPNSPFRKWRDTEGNVLATGEFVALQSGKVCLQTEEGTGTFVALDRLSEADKQYVAQESSGDLAEPPVAKTSQDGTDPKTDSEYAANHPSGPVDGSAGARPEGYGSDPRKVVIPFDFESKFDDGRYGAMVGDMVWKKIDRAGGFLLPDTMLDVRDLCTENGVQLGPGASMSRVEEVVRNHFDADIGIWGSVERVAGHEWDVYDLVIKCVDFTSEPEPKTIYEVSARTETVSEIPHLYGEQLLNKLYDREPGGPPPIDPIAEENWKANPSLVVGDFQRGTNGVPTGWSSVGGQHREPLGGLVSWVAESGSSDSATYSSQATNRVIRLTFDKGIGNSYGVMYYSDWFPVDEGARYRFQCRYRTNGPAVKVFIKCYDAMGSKYNEASAAEASAGKTSTRDTTGSRPSKDRYAPQADQRRECYRSQQNLKGPKNVWNTQTEDFTPKHTKYVPKWGRVMLYGYLGAGVVEFDDVVVKQIIPASSSERKKTPRHSMESTVTIDEMLDNEQRGREAADRLRQESSGEP